MVFVEGDSFRSLRRLPTDAFRSIPRLPREDLVLPVAASDLVAWYPFRQGDGSDATAGDSNFGDTTDYSGTVQGVTFTQGSVTDIQTGLNSQAAVGDGVDDLIDIPDNTLSFNTTAGNITVCFWARPDDDSEDILIESRNPVDCPVRKGTAQRPNEIAMSTFDGSTATFVGADFTVGQLDHFAFVFNNNELRAHKNGSRVETAQNVTAKTAALDVLLFGTRKANENDYDGLLDDIRFYQGGLSDNQINKIYLNTEP